ncbi:hypothetical protein [Methanobacterium subterraneum]|uniref:hypothetical protein n=2 Tax=Methanobacterium TaxID=2160 RepID=UPI001300081E|nr:hypothetical protein [Methanobacterium subterraneum]
MGVKIMVETQQASGGGMIAMAIIIGIIILIFPFLVYWLAWFSVFMLFIGGVVALMTQ